MREKKQDIITVNKVHVQQQVWDKLRPSIQRRIYHFVIIDTEVKEKDEHS